MIDNKHSNKQFERIKNMQAYPGVEAFDLREMQKYEIHIRADESVPAAMFKPDPLNPAGHIANSLTIRAMRKDLFALGEDPGVAEDLRSCASCKSTYDVQFWLCCPYCGREQKT